MPEKVQFIGYAVNTAPSENAAYKQVYLGLKNEVDDFTARVALLQNVFDQAEAHAKINSGATKIVTIPEFFFRGQNGAYTLETINGHGDPSKKGTRGLIGALQELVKNAKWKKWVFVFGSIIGYSAKTKEKTVQVDKIIMPFYKVGIDPSKTPTVKKPVDENELTVEEFFRYTVLETELLAAFKKDAQVKTKSNLESLAKITAKNCVLGIDSTDADVKRVTDATNTKFTRDVFLKVTDSKNQQKYAKKYPFNWTFVDDTSKATEAYNIALTIEGGFENIADAYKHTNITMKNYKSGIDFVKKANLDKASAALYKGNTSGIVVDDTVEHLDPWGLIRNNGTVDKTKADELADPAKNHKDYGQTTTSERYRLFWKRDVTGVNDNAGNLDPLGIFKLGNLTFGIDLCLDHSKQVTKKLLNALAHPDIAAALPKVLPDSSRTVVANAANGVDIQIIPSCGMSITNHGVMAKVDGWVFNCDGMAGEIARDGDKYKIDGTGDFITEAGYTNSTSNTSTSLGNAHSGLKKVTALDKTLAKPGTTALAPYDTTKVTRVDTAVDAISQSGAPLNAVVSTGSPLSPVTSAQLFSDGAVAFYTVKVIDPTKTEIPLQVKYNGPVSGQLHIYETVDV
ncbi:MAG: hypothetical protein CENE_03437 [Candidatus Celerinatantimonas neptuna]|nr:MAG: hypothetical protein CENE_03437 [Candidatus Celerinatantimonas neptuna]